MSESLTDLNWWESGSLKRQGNVSSFEWLRRVLEFLGTAALVGRVEGA